MSTTRAWLASCNVLVLASAGLAFVLARAPLAGPTVGPLLAGGPLVQRQLVELQRDLERWPADLGRGLRLARLLVHAGDAEQSLELLRQLERRLAPEPLLQLELVAAYADLGWPAEALRLLRAAVARCAATAAACTSGDRARLGLALQAAAVMLGRRDGPAAARPPRDLWREVLKPASVGPAPREPRPGGAVPE